MIHTCPVCRATYARTYEEHTGSERHRAAVAAATGRTPAWLRRRETGDLRAKELSR